MNPRVDGDFAEEVLLDLYAYRRKRRWLALLLWGTLGWFGAHRFYLERAGSGLLMLFSLGGGFVWWIVDGFLVSGLVRRHNAEQDQRERTGLPPVQLAFMPPLARDVLEQPPEWTERWRARSKRSRRLRIAGDVIVLVTVGVALGAVARRADVWEAVVAVLALVALTSAAGAVGRVGHLPVIRGLIRWSHRLRLFYYYSRPGHGLALLMRPVTGAVLAPFQQRARAEVRLYLQLGGVFTLFFLLLDFGGEVIGPLFGRGAMAGIAGLLRLWLAEAIVTFIVIYSFATPVGAVLNKYLLLMPRHTVPRLLGALVAGCVVLGLVV